MALTAEQLADLQGDLGISADESVFTNDELERLFARAEEDYATSVYLGWRQLLGSTAKFFKYTAGHTSVDRSMVFDHVKAMVEFWAGESRTAGNQLMILGLTEIPPRIKDDPDVPVTRIRHWNWGPR